MGAADKRRPVSRGDVVSEIVARDLCIGCGACAASCAHGRIVGMTEGTGGAPVPALGRPGPCEVACGACLSVCPFWPGNPNEDDLATMLFETPSHAEGIGAYSALSAAASLVGSDRTAGSSGGVGTWIARRVLETGFADAVLVVAGAQASGAEQYMVCRQVGEVEACGGSRYVPVSLDRALAECVGSGERVVIFALPCVAKAVRLMCTRLPRYDQAVAGVVGLACGHNKRPDFWRFLAGRHGIVSDARVLSFRVKREGRPANDFGVTITGRTLDGSQREVTLGWLDDVAPWWSHKWFSMHACLFCDDMMAECADVTLMDAWLPRYQSDSRGTTLVVERSDLLGALADDSGDTLWSEPVGERDVLASQAAALAWKRDALSNRLHEARLGPETPPGKKRVEPGQAGVLSDRVRWSLDARIARESWGFASPMEPSDERRVARLVRRAAVTDRLISVLRRIGV